MFYYMYPCGNIRISNTSRKYFQQLSNECKDFLFITLKLQEMQRFSARVHMYFLHTQKAARTFATKEQRGVCYLWTPARQISSVSWKFERKIKNNSR
jgi:hypothetical protein